MNDKFLLCILIAVLGICLIVYIKHQDERCKKNPVACQYSSGEKVGPF